MRHTSLMCLTGTNSETEGSDIVNKLCESNKSNGVDALGGIPVTWRKLHQEMNLDCLPRSDAPQVQTSGISEA